MSWLDDLPLQRKLRVGMLFTSTLALVLAGGLFLTIQFVAYRNQVADTVATLARVTAANSTAAIAFADPARAAETLHALQVEPQVRAAILLTTEGVRLAHYPDGPPEALPPGLDLTTATVRFSGRSVLGVEPVVEDGRRLGTLYVRASLDRVYARLGQFALVVAGVLTASFLLALVLASILGRTLARPVLELVETTSAVAAGQDYSLRARQYATDELGQLTHTFNLMLERTENALAQLGASKTQLQLVTDHAPVFLAHLDREQRFRFLNRTAASRLGLRIDQVIGRHAAEVLGAPAYAVVGAYMSRALAGENVEFEAEVPYPTVGPRWMHVIYVPERDPRGDVVGFVGVISDITGRKQAEREVLQARDQALAASRAKDDFLASLSHELRTPLNPVLLLASEAAENRALPETVRADFAFIARHAALEARLIDDLLDLTRITRGKLGLDLQTFDLHPIVHDVLATVRPDLEQKGLHLTLRLHPAVAPVRGDVVRIQQVLWNLFKNAVKFTPEQGSITIATDLTDTQAVLTVQDTGLGLTPAELERVFHAFAQGDHAEAGGSHRFGGLGLGLAISRLLVELHRGTIQASSPGRGLGSTFEVRLPLAVLADGLPTEPNHHPRPPGGSAEPFPVAPTPASGPDGAIARVLLVEDHAATRTTVAHLLTRRGFEVVAVATLAEARAAASGQPFTLVVSDLGLPDGNGYTLMRELREAQPDLPGVALSGYGMEEDRARSRAAGFSEHLTKPVSVTTLMAALRRLLGQPAGPG